jgi:hypothetical protein
LKQLETVQAENTELLDGNQRLIRVCADRDQQILDLEHFCSTARQKIQDCQTEINRLQVHDLKPQVAPL